MKKINFFFYMLIAAILTFEQIHSAVLLDRIVATVNDEVITWSELMNAIILDGKQFVGDVTGSEREAKIREMERPFLNDLIEMKLQLQEARKMDLDVNDAEIDGAINEIRIKYGLTEEALENSLKEEGLTTADYRSKLADQILLQKAINIAVRNTIVITDKELAQYYEENRADYDEGERIRIRQIFFALPEDSTQKEALEERARELMARINAGADFAQLAREFSEDPSREFGGDLGYMRRGSALKEIEDAALALNKGEVSKPLWSSAGLHIIKLEDRIEGGGADNVMDKIREVLLQTSFERKYHDWKAGLREKAYIEIKL